MSLSLSNAPQSFRSSWSSQSMRFETFASSFAVAGWFQVIRYTSAYNSVVAAILSSSVSSGWASQNSFPALNAQSAYTWSPLWMIRSTTCLLYTSDAADEEDSVDLGGRRII
eukprot:TRINITY_DN16395_c0_g1_i4.p1 TRINITY_DN16395_c0_g1~~TRINITY_DN16395_c0_g1_i4.p1  ORF type:complete len:112 (-),score=18.08 TRINITY_DN16395_c0_g1_i4:65-400(-)